MACERLCVLITRPIVCSEEKMGLAKERHPQIGKCIQRKVGLNSRRFLLRWFQGNRTVYGMGFGSEDEHTYVVVS